MEIHILDGADIPNPEDRAMVQALYSRDPRSVTEHLEKVRRVGSGKFMAQFYIGYGHKSIGDCGDITICVEDCSILAAKAIQDSPLYRGQEASTRYLDMAARPLVSPTPEIRERQERWMELYRRATAELPALIRAEYPQRATDDDKVYEKAVRARAFDIARSLLPAGVTTFVSWTTDLRHAADHLEFLAHHPLQEVRDVAEALRVALVVRYPSSFARRVPRPIAEVEYLELLGAFAYGQTPVMRLPSDYWRITSDTLDRDCLSILRKTLSSRPARCELPRYMRRHGAIEVTAALDYGSWRDLQRHRSMIAQAPLLNAWSGFHIWYLDRLPAAVAASARAMAAEDREIQDSLDREQEVEAQYHLPLGMIVAVEAQFTLPSAVYVAELRSGQSVHPTLRALAQRLACYLKSELPYMALHADMSPDEWSLRRGKQDIVEVKA